LKPRKPRKPRKTIKRSLKKLKEKAWQTFSRYIRNKYSVNGYVSCVTCGVRKPIKEMQAGHFIDGRMNSILFHPQCVHPQCYICNIHKHGDKINYYKYMLKTYGQQVIDKLIDLSNTTVKFTEEDYRKIISKYSQ